MIHHVSGKVAIYCYFLLITVHRVILVSMVAPLIANLSFKIYCTVDYYCRVLICTVLHKTTLPVR